MTLALDSYSTRFLGQPVESIVGSSLHDFKKLESLWLNISVVQIVGEKGPDGTSLAYFLPVSIRKLHLGIFNTGIPVECRSELDQLAAAVERGQYPNLTEITMKARGEVDAGLNIDYGESKMWFVSLKDRFKALGIELSDKSVRNMLPLATASC